MKTILQCFLRLIGVCVNFVSICYISTQICIYQIMFLSFSIIGPLNNTIGDMWRLIWQQKVEVIVMLTNFKEGEKVCIKLLFCLEILEIILTDIIR